MPNKKPKPGKMKTWHPGTPREQSAANRKIAANKRAAAKVRPSSMKYGKR